MNCFFVSLLKTEDKYSFHEVGMKKKSFLSKMKKTKFFFDLFGESEVISCRN